MPAQAQQRVLPISPVQQQTPVWCWAAVAEMVLRHLRMPNINPGNNYQCGVVGTLGGQCAYDCRLCVTTIGSIGHLAQVLENYPRVVRSVSARAVPDLAMMEDSALDPEGIIDEIDAGRPIIAGISPSGQGFHYPAGMSEHVALIVGYRVQGNRLLLYVNDPMPFSLFPFDPYRAAGASPTRPGQYLIEYGAFRGRLGYKDSLYGFEHD
jgi:hypothetical protein